MRHLRHEVNWNSKGIFAVVFVLAIVPIHSVRGLPQPYPIIRVVALSGGEEFAVTEKALIVVDL